ncbi:MAG: aminoacyl-tRNA hydrolase [Pseudomonadales bacterium]|nr:aminoacyl-tRNA hydrolase [Pseudomonadales bacterium]MBO6594756.1 aminoacyl-tRNA hydrolase [Pseudomonadales bacterium]MBO6656561.1 aminoacyl-tRNA hydrolase [Pseudomonadales bacterium]MBO6821684.1 aminoacyl-tRNA hydrolase [Pseudomonadales bacterium]
MIRVVDIPESEIEWSAIRASGPGGQHVNKVSTGVHLRFDLKSSSLSEALKEKLLRINDSRINSDGVVVIKSVAFRSQEKNRLAALDRLDQLLEQAQRVQKPRRKTRPTKASVKRRLDSKKKQGDRKKSRRPVDY